MNLEDLLKDVVIEKAINPEDKKTEVYRAVYQLAGKNPIYLTGWFKTIEDAIEAAKENLLAGILDGKRVKLENQKDIGNWVNNIKNGISLGALSLLGNFKDKTSSVLNFAGDKIDDIKELLKKLFLFKNGKALLNGNENEIGSNLLKLFGGFEDAENEALKTTNSVLLENASKVVKRVEGNDVSLESLDVLVNNREDNGIKMLDRLVDNSKEDLKEENKSLKDYFLSYFDGLKGKKDASPLYANTKPLRDKLAELLGGIKKGFLPGIGSLGALGLAGFAGSKALSGEGLNLAKNNVDADLKPLDNKTNINRNTKNDEEKEKKGALWPKLALGAGALGLISLPFWAIPYNVTANLPLGTTLKGNLPEKVKFYEKVDLPEASFGDMKFEGWFTDPSFKNPINQLSSTLGSKNLYPKFSEDLTGLNSSVDVKLGDLSGLLSGLKGIGDLPESVRGNLQKEYDDISAAIDDAQTKFKAGNLDGDSLKALLGDLDGLNTKLKGLQKQYDDALKVAEQEAANNEADSAFGANASTSGTNATGTNATGSNASGTNASGANASGNNGNAAGQTNIPNTSVK